MSEKTRLESARRVDLALPEGFTARRPRLEDLEEALELLNHCLSKIDRKDCVTADELRSEWTDPQFDLATDGLVIEDSGGRIVAWEEVYNRSSHVILECWSGMVHPSVRGLGLEEALLAWVEECARTHVARAPASAEVELRVGIDVRDDFRRGILEGAGLSVVRHFFGMVIDLDEPARAPTWPPGVTIRELRPGADESAYFRVKREAFLDHWGIVDPGFEEGFERFRHWLETSPDYDPSLFRAAFEGEEIAGICFTWPSHNDDSDEAYVSHVAVRRPWRRRGLATALLLDAFLESRRRGKKRVALGVDAANVTGAVGLYENVGMRIARRYDLYAKVLRPGVRAKEEEQ
jgi:ribosomal protein S18 acetylase RimI-like enzyme